jgi:hypothetical protein
VLLPCGIWSWRQSAIVAAAPACAANPAASWRRSIIVRAARASAADTCPCATKVTHAHAGFEHRSAKQRG